MKTEQVRYSFRVQGAMRRRMDLAKEVAGQPSDAEVARYLINRGLEAMSRELDLHVMRQRLEKELNAQELLPFVKEAFNGKGASK